MNWLANLLTNRRWWGYLITMAVLTTLMIKRNIRHQSIITLYQNYWRLTVDNSDIHLAAIFAGAFIVAAMIGHIQDHPVPVSAIKAGLIRFNQWVINGGVLEASVFCAACGVLVATITYPWSY